MIQAFEDAIDPLYFGFCFFSDQGAQK